MITFFTIPKAFAGHSGVIQRNAALSWTKLVPACEVLLMGDDPGVAEVAAEFGVKHVPQVARNEFGTPLLDSAFRLASEQAKFPLVCYINADIMLTNDFLRAASRLSGRFLMIGQRWDVDLKTPWDFSGDDWEARLKRYVREEGKLHPAAGSDYFLFPRGDAQGVLPPFAVGRPGWDNWFIGNARKQGVPVLDATMVTTVIHQNHGYGHVPQAVGNSYEGPEGRRNFQIAGDVGLAYTLEDATRLMTPGGLRPAWQKRHFKHRWNRMVIERAWPVVTLLIAKVLASRVKRVFVPYPEGYRPPPLRRQIGELFDRKSQPRPDLSNMDKR